MLRWDLRGCSHAAPFFYTNCWKSPNCSFRVITHIRDSQLKLSKTALQRGLLRQHARKIRDPNLLKNSRPKPRKIRRSVLSPEPVSPGSSCIACPAASVFRSRISTASTTHSVAAPKGIVFHGKSSPCCTPPPSVVTLLSVPGAHL